MTDEEWADAYREHAKDDEGVPIEHRPRSARPPRTKRIQRRRAVLSGIRTVRYEVKTSIISVGIVAAVFDVVAFAVLIIQHWPAWLWTPRKNYGVSTFQTVTNCSARICAPVSIKPN